MDAHEAQLLLHMRQRFNQILRRAVTQPQKITMSTGDLQCLEFLARSLEHEEGFCGLERQRDVGRRPIAVKLNMNADQSSSSNGLAERHARLQNAAGGAATSNGDNGKFFQQPQPQPSWRSTKRAGAGEQNAAPGGRFGGNGGATSKLAAGIVRGTHSAQTNDTHRNDRQWRAESRVSTEAARFFIVHASSEMQVQQHFREPNGWCWSHDVLKELIVTNIVSVSHRRTV